MKETLNTLLNEALEKIKGSKTQQDLEAVRLTLLGKKGKLTSILKQMGSISAEERPIIGKEVNKVRNILETKLSEKCKELKNKDLQAKLLNEKIDVTIPGKPQTLGHKHPISTILDEITEIFVEMGFNVVEGPEVEYSTYNFDALNIPKNHPARAEQDTFYVNEDILLRTQTSPVQIRVMKQKKPPIRILSPGRVFRADSVDATHSPIFHQVEGLVVDKGITFADLKGCLESFIKRLYGKDTLLRFRPHHFPFTEPSAEVDIQCFACKGEGCSLCKGEGWIEILGCGMVHPSVLKACDIDSDIYSGFAFGLGLERMCMRRYDIDDLRLFFENDVRFLNQF